MLRTIIISPDRELSAEVHRVCAQVDAVKVIRLMDYYPSTIELTRFVRAQAPQLVIISAESVSNVMSIATHLEQVSPGVQVIAAGKQYEADTLITLMRAGVREFIASPLSVAAFSETIARVAEALARRPMAVHSTELVYSFLPAKPGVGATSLAVNSALQLTSEPNVPALLCDFDLNCGIIRFLLKLQGSYSVLDAAERAQHLDESLWRQLVDTFGKLDVLHAGMLNPEIRLDHLYMQHLVDYARRNYKVLCFDLSGNMERYSLELMHESKKIFLVTTTEVCALHLAREKVQYLRRMDLAERVSVLVNRYNKRSPIDVDQVEQLVGAPVLMTFANDYTRLTKAVAEGKPVDGTCELGRQCQALGEFMLDKKPAIAVREARRRFVEYFSISPSRFTLESRNTTA